MKPIISNRWTSAAFLTLFVITAHAETSTKGAVASATAASDDKAMKLENRRLAKAVLRVLAKTNGLDPSNIVVVAKAGAVTLEGSVPNAGQIELATSAAKSVAGATTVTNKLSLSTRADGQ